MTHLTGSTGKCFEPAKALAEKTERPAGAWGREGKTGVYKLHNLPVF